MIYCSFSPVQSWIFTHVHLLVTSFEDDLEDKTMADSVNLRELEENDSNLLLVTLT